ncbi:MAG TPA: type II toxin-antitoxin system HicA family toxin [Candidatus Tripitaka californicus]|uniref:type II toxin-antitoxin system HicA family toxin n=1 Tax=Candidatus Tripitaka californicus TaxID=3367616 RepID=UPI004024C514|nr:type II toxin-antitoxin system HicA family toxin [Planctomycetota bacterium]
MAIEYGRLRSLTARELTSALTRDGFVLDRQSGSHQHYRHSDGRRVTVSFHRSGETFPLKTLKRIIADQACWSEDDLRRLKILP